MMLNEKHILIYSQIYTIPTMPTSFAVILRKFKGQLPVFSDRELSILFSKFLFIFGSAGSSFLQGFFSSWDEQGCPLDAVLRFLTAVAPLVFFFYSTGSRAQALQLWHRGLAAPQHVGSSPIRDWTRVSCIGRWFPYHRATRKVHSWVFLKNVIFEVGFGCGWAQNRI